MGMVYLGRDDKIGRTVAIKTMVLGADLDEEMHDEVKARFFREAEAAGRLDHPNIVTVYDVGDEQDLDRRCHTERIRKTRTRCSLPETHGDLSAEAPRRVVSSTQKNRWYDKME